MTIGEKIKLLREEREWSQEYLSQLLGYKSRSTINKIEMNINELTQSKIVAFANVFGIQSHELLSDDPLNMEDIRTRWEERYNRKGCLAAEAKLFDSLQTQYGKQAVALFTAFTQLNTDGQQKAVENVQDLLDVPKYRKGD